MGQPTTATAFVGIDVSKATLDACLLRPRRKARAAAFANDPAGHAALIAWADRHAGGLPAHFCLEATGPYSDPPATALAEAGRHVSVAAVVACLRKLVMICSRALKNCAPSGPAWASEKAP